MHGSAAVLQQAIVDPLVLLTVGGARSRHEVEGSSEVQNEISRGELAGVRASARAARRRDGVALCRREGRVEVAKSPQVVPDLEWSAIEGDRRLKEHLRRERARSLVKAKLASVLEIEGRIACDVCGFMARKHSPA